MGEVWHISTSTVTEGPLLAASRALLVDDEPARLAAFHFDRHRHEYLVTRALCRAVLSRALGCAPRSLRFRRNEYGRPELVPSGSLQFNLSNTDGFVVCAIAQGRAIGVDTEPLSSAERILEVSDTVFVREELDGLARLSGGPKRECAVRLWTLKEAYMKARGMGMSIPPQSFAVDAEDPREPRLVSVPRDDVRERWALATHRVGDHVVATCLERRPGRDDAISYHRADLADMLL